VLAIKPYQELMKLFLGSTRDVIEVLGLEICIFRGQFVLQAPLLLIHLGQQKIR
jgi:hypothetical protein